MWGGWGWGNVYMFNMNIMFFGVWKLFKWFREMWVSHLVVSWALPVCYDEIKSEMVPVYIERVRKEPLCLWVPLAMVCTLPGCRRTGFPVARASRSLVLIVRILLCGCMAVHRWHRTSGFGLLLISSADFTTTVQLWNLLPAPVHPTSSVLLPQSAAMAFSVLLLRWYLATANAGELSYTISQNSRPVLPRLNWLFTRQLC